MLDQTRPPPELEDVDVEVVAVLLVAVVPELAEVLTLAAPLEVVGVPLPLLVVVTAAEVEVAVVPELGPEAAPELELAAGPLVPGPLVLLEPMGDC